MNDEPKMKKDNVRVRSYDNPYRLSPDHQADPCLVSIVTWAVALVALIAMVM